MNYGSNIKFAEAKNNWLASASMEYNDTIFIRENKIWIDKSLDGIIKRMINIIPHETIHNILWSLGADDKLNYDKVRNKIIYNGKVSRRIRNIYYGCM